MNLVQVQNQIRGLSDQQLQQAYMQNSGEVPPFLILAESKRRQDMRQAGAQQQTAMQASQPSIAEQIMAPPRPPMAPQGQPGAMPPQGAPAQGAPMGQSGMPQIQGPAQGGIKAFAGGGQVRGYFGGGLAATTGEVDLSAAPTEELSPLKALAEKLKMARDYLVHPTSSDTTRPKDYQADTPRKTADDYPPAESAPARPATPAAPSAPAPTAARPTPEAGIQTLATPPEMQGPPAPSPLEALRDAAKAAQRPNYSKEYDELMKGAPVPGANLKSAVEKQQATLDARLKEAKDQRLQNFFLQLASGQSQNALTNIGGALKAEAEGFNKVSGEVAKQRDELLFKLAEAQDAGDEKTFNRSLEKLKILALDQKSEDELRKELFGYEEKIAAARNDAERTRLARDRALVEAEYRRRMAGAAETRAAGAGAGKPRTPEQINKDVVAAVKSVNDTMTKDPVTKVTADKAARAAGQANFIAFYEDLARKALANGQQPPSMQQAMSALRSGGVAPAGGARAPKVVSFQEVK